MRAAIGDYVTEASICIKAGNHAGAIEQYKLARALANRLGEQETINDCTNAIGKLRRKESIARYRRGVEVWNEWASGLLAERHAKQSRNEWTEEAEEAWQEDAFVDFSHHRFVSGDDFDHYVFPAEVCFEEASFWGPADFRGTTFHGLVKAFSVDVPGDLTFLSVTFKDIVGFSRSTVGGSLILSDCSFHNQALFDGLNAKGRSSFSACHFGRDVSFEEVSFDESLSVSDSTFLGEASFLGATFSGWLRFRKCTFGGTAIFRGAGFDEAVAFDNTTFSGYTSFQGSQFAGLCTFSKTRVERVPVFVETQFNEPPTLDGLEGLDWKDAKKHQAKPEEIGLPARWRAFRRLAQQGGNDERALRFYGAEVRSRRGTEDRPWHLRYWVGYAFEFGSGFGLSVSKPIAWLGSILVAASLFHLCMSPSEDATYSTAFVVSFCNTAPFSLFCSSASLEQGYALLGWKTQAGATLIPGWVTVARAVQACLTSALLFLALLAIRNWFRIR